MTSVVKLENFSFRYPHMEKDIIHDVSLTIEEGTFTLLHGLSGSGKSTLCYALTGLIPWSVRGFFKGNVKVLGLNTSNVKPNQFAGKIGYLMQNPDSQFATLNVQDELVFAAENIRIAKDIINQRLSMVIELLDLQDYLGRNVTQLSSGEKQKVVLGSILMMEPSLLILDEPLSFLDYPNRMKLLEYLRRISNRYTKLSIIIAEHRINEIFPLANNFLEIKEGKLVSTEYMSISPERYFHDNRNYLTYEDLVKHYGFQESTNEGNHDKKNQILTFNDVTFEYVQDHGKHERKISPVFRNLSFNIHTQESIAIIGPNGIGKTTLLYLLAGIIQPTSGEIHYKSKNIANMDYGRYSKNIGLIFQNPESQLLKNTIRKEIEFGPKNFHESITENELMQFTEFIFPTSKNGPKVLLSLHPFNLSWGEKRRLNLASLFAYSPSIYLFDEPFTGQDYNVRKRLIKIIQSVSNRSGATIFTSHDEEILEFCNRVFLLDSKGLTIFSKRSNKS